MADKILDLFTKEEWENLCNADPTLRAYETASPWQDYYADAKVYLAEDPLAEVMGTTSNEKGKSPKWRSLQKTSWRLYRTFGQVGSAINSKSDFIVGYGFNAFSINLAIRQFLKDLLYSRRNRLYSAFFGWVIRMLAEGELFILFVFDEEGRATIRLLEPDRIGEGDDNDGLIVDPDDVTQTFFYEHHGAKAIELIPDIGIAFNPELMKKASKLENFDKEKLQPSRGNKKFAKLGGYRRFVLHWKNLTGMHEYRRDISVVAPVIEAIHLYWNAIKWQLDHKKALCFYANVISFEDSPMGMIAHALWKKLPEEDKKKTGLTKTPAPGSTLFLLPGMKFQTVSPQLSKMQGENQDLINIAGAGLRSPQDLFQGQASGYPYASLKASRSPLEIEIKNTQYKFGNFLTYEFLRACFHVATVFGLLDATYKKREVSDFINGKPTFEDVDVDPIDLVQLAFPEVVFEEEIEGKTNAYLGSKHAGLRAMGISDYKIAERMGIHDLDRQRVVRALEDERFGEKKTTLEEGKSSDKTQEVTE